MTKENIELSRRKVLAGLGAVGAAGAGAGLGTSALFSDEESFVDNVITAGELDLYVGFEYSADQGAVSGNLAEPTEGIVQGDAAGGGEILDVGYVLDDLKPGDSGSAMYCPRVVDNPAWVRADVTGLTDYENGQTEPEAEVDDSGGDPGEGAGELSEAIQVTVSYCDENGETIREMDNPDDYSLADLANEEAFLLDGNEGEEEEDDGASPYPGSESSEDQQGPCICIDWEVPADVGNEIQSDSVEWDVTFYAEQRRHNDTPLDAEYVELGPSAAQNTGFEAQSGGGFTGTGYWQDDPGQTNQDGGDYEQLYITFEEAFGPYYVDSLATFTIEEIESIRYRTRRPSGASQDYFVDIFTFPDGSNDDASWYGRQLQTLPEDALNKSVSANTWLTWRTETGTNQLTFYDYNHDYDTTDSNAPPYLGQDTGVTLADLQSTDSFDWSDYVSNADSTPKNYRDEEVRALRFATASNWEDSHEGGLDAIEIELTDGSGAVIDLED
jgi:predicted ribosomally synthesized peptide with SipW-like signal peptide